MTEQDENYQEKIYCRSCGKEITSCELCEECSQVPGMSMKDVFESDELMEESYKQSELRSRQ